MSHRQVIAAAVLGALALCADNAGDAQTAAPAASTPQWRTSWGHPDLQGTWSSDDVRGIPLQRPEELGTRAEQTDEEFAERLAGYGVPVVPFGEPVRAMMTWGWIPMPRKSRTLCCVGLVFNSSVAPIWGKKVT